MKATRRKRPLKLGIVCNEFFDPDIGRMGGFGWLADQAAQVLRADPELGVEPVFLTGELYGDGRTEVVTKGGVRLILRQREAKAAYLWRVRRERFDVLLAVDYRPNYSHLLSMMPRTPVILWVQDPRTSSDWQKIRTLRVPGDSAEVQGIAQIDCTPYARDERRSRWLARGLTYASPAPAMLLPKCGETLAVAVESLAFLGYPVRALQMPLRVVKAPRPRVVFLGRLDPIKRPWLFAELAQSFPGVEFLFMGRNHFTGPGSWQPSECPSNVRFLGHVDGRGKQEILMSAWVLVNTSVHEALPVSFIEALMCETPILSCHDPELVATRFGRFVGPSGGDGMAELPRFAEGMEWLLADASRRIDLGVSGRRWAEENHTPQRFTADFGQICGALGAL